MGISNWKVVELRACLRITLKGGDRHFRYILLNLYKLVAYWCFNGDLDWGGGGGGRPMSHVEFKKWPCRHVEFSGPDPF